MSLDPKLPSRYEVVRELGRGGMGVVYLAHDRVHDRSVAVKLLNADAADDADRHRFRREASELAALSHPNVVAFHEAGEHEGRAFIAMEYVAGGSLHDRIAQHPGWREVARLFLGICAGLGHAHAHGVVHRDLKPENVLLTPDGVPKLTDFGLARKLDGNSNLTRSGTVLGTFSYIAPEQASSSHVGPAADLYALGVCLFEALTGALPFTSASEVDMIFQHITAIPPAPASMHAELPAGLDALVLRLLEKMPEHRPRSAEEVAEALAAALAEEDAPAPAGAEARLRLVGRADELGRLVKAMARCADGGSAAVLLTAAAGMGRSRLLQEAAAHLQARRIRVLRAGGNPAAGHHLEALAVQLGARPGELSALHAEAGPEQAAAALRSWLGACPDPVVLLADDVERMEGAAAVLEALAGLAPPARGGWLLSIEEGRAASWTLHPDLERQGLPPLPHESVAALAAQELGGTLDRELADWIAARAAGSPRTVRLLSGALRAAGALRESEGVWFRAGAVVLPEALTDLVRTGLEGLDDGTRRFLTAAALLDEPFDPELAAAAAETPDEALDERLERALQAGLLDEAWADRQELYRFSSALVRDGLAQALPDRPRRRMHARIADLLAARGAPPAARGRHLLAAGRPAEALPLLVEGAEAAHRQASHRQAERLWELARGCLPSSASEVDALRVEVGACETLIATGRGAEAAAALEPRCAQPPSPEAQVPHARALYLLGNLEFRGGNYEGALARARQGLAELGVSLEAPRLQDLSRAALREAAWLCTLPVKIHRRQGRTDEALRCIDTALQVGRAAGDLEIEADFLLHQGLIHKGRGEADAAAASYQQALSLARQLARPLQTMACLNDLGILYQDLMGDAERALRCHQEVLDTARRLGDGLWEAAALSNMAVSYHARGEWARVSELLEQAARLQRRQGARNPLGHTLANLGESLAVQGDSEAAERAYREALELTDETGDSEVRYMARQGLGLLLFDLGRADDALACLTDALGLAEAGGDRPGQVEARAALVRVLLQSGRGEEAQTQARQAAEAAETGRDAYLRGLACMALGMCRTGARAWNDARAALEEARELLAESGRAVPAADAVAELGRLYLAAAAAGVPGWSFPDGLQRLEEALRRYTEAGAFGRIRPVQLEIDAHLASRRLE